MAYENYTTLSVQVRGRVAYATINNPPVNVITGPLYDDLLRLSLELEADDNLLVFVLRSANPDFFIAHFDVSSILEFPIEGEPKHEDYANAFYHDMCERYRLMNKVTIAQIEGRVGGGGSELAMSFDMRFGVRGKTFVNQMEVPLGILPGGTGTQRMPRIIGRNRAMEVIMGGVDMDADTAAEAVAELELFAVDDGVPVPDPAGVMLGVPVCEGGADSVLEMEGLSEVAGV